MSAATSLNLTYIAVLVVSVLALYRLCRTPRPSKARRLVWDFAAEEWVRLPQGAEPKPGQMTGPEIADADPLELLYLSPAYDPEFDAGLDRLRQAVRDEQNKGD